MKDLIGYSILIIGGVSTLLTLRNIVLTLKYRKIKKRVKKGARS